ncbi:hypothetical protein CONLIGDRAFT_643005 [Coniochaeta ligniaria NRRL 30616]|uniref:Uncharacterized protein n=1 Tax=Coniochaeta ligniaria NRRL 30616 TaxID=1408157 RepID=A0A1J7JCC8_9PEZI|nr:hypothetical protein CONLIGDRAFT_643005 [Coniochaeta ligniaria NRRL 30616]
MLMKGRIPPSSLTLSRSPALLPHHHRPTRRSRTMSLLNDGWSYQGEYMQVRKAAEAFKDMPATGNIEPGSQIAGLLFCAASYGHWENLHDPCVRPETSRASRIVDDQPRKNPIDLGVTVVPAAGNDGVSIEDKGDIWPRISQFPSGTGSTGIHPPTGPREALPQMLLKDMNPKIQAFESKKRNVSAISTTSPPTGIKKVPRTASPPSKLESNLDVVKRLYDAEDALYQGKQKLLDPSHSS